MMRLNPAPSLVTQASDPSLALQRHMLVSSLFKYAAEIQEIEDGYAFKFRRSELLIRRIAEYIVFEGQHSPQLVFVLVSEPNDGAVWLQVRGSDSEKEHTRTAICHIKCVRVLHRKERESIVREIDRPSQSQFTLSALGNHGTVPLPSIAFVDGCSPSARFWMALTIEGDHLVADVSTVNTSQN